MRRRQRATLKDGTAVKKRSKPTPQPWWRSGLIAALDIGTTKISCLIGRLNASNELRIVGVGHHASRGVRSGTLVDLEAAEVTIRATVDAAERMAGETIRHVVVNVSAGQPRSRLIVAEVAVAGHDIGDADVRRVLDPVHYGEALANDHEVVHAIPVGYSIDGTNGVHDPRGMYGQRLRASLHVITASSGALRNLSTCVARCYLEIAAKAVSPYAAALGTLVEDEKSLGVTLIDMGGGSTSVAVFFDSQLVHTETLPVGGNHVTRDLARGLSTPIPQAERIKTLYGSCQPSQADGRQMIEVPPITDDGVSELGQVPRSLLVNIIRPRVEEIFEMVRARSGGCRLRQGRRPARRSDRRRLSVGRHSGSGDLDPQQAGPGRTAPPHRGIAGRRRRSGLRHLRWLARLRGDADAGKHRPFADARPATASRPMEQDRSLAAGQLLICPTN